MQVERHRSKSVAVLLRICTLVCDQDTGHSPILFSFSNRRSTSANCLLVYFGLQTNLKFTPNRKPGYGIRFSELRRAVSLVTAWLNFYLTGQSFAVCSTVLKRIQAAAYHLLSSGVLFISHLFIAYHSYACGVLGAVKRILHREDSASLDH